MSRFHNNKLNTVSLFDEDPTTPTHKPSRKRGHNMPAPECHSKNLLQHNGPIETYRGPEVDNSYVNYGFESDMHRRGQYHGMGGYVAPAQAPMNNGGSTNAVSKSVGVKHSPGFNKAGADTVREESKEKVQVLNEAQDQKPVVVDDDVFNIDSHRAHNKDSDVDYLQPDGDASKVGQGFGVSGHKSPVAQRRPTLYRNDAQTHLEVNKFVDDTQMYGSGANYHGREMESVDLDSFELVDEDNEALLRHPRSAFIPEMSPLSGHAYESPYSFQVEEGQDVSGHSPVWHGSGQRGAQGFLGLACSPQDGLPPLEAGHIPDSFPHDVFANCGFTQGSYVDVPMAEAYDGYGFNAGHFS